jgi:uncharacterized protein
MKPILINNLDLAKNQGEISGTIAIDECERLTEFLSQDGVAGQKISYELSGTATKFHLPSLSLSINATLPVICQRCLEELALSLSLNHDYVLNESEPAPFEGDDDIDWLEISREMNLNALVEDELLMAMPLAPTHAHDCKLDKQVSGEKHNPFAVLKDLIK